MSNKFWLYTSRKGAVMLFPFTDAGWDAARKMQDDDNRMNIETLIEQFGEDAVWGSKDEERFSADDGGEIYSIRVEDV